MLPLSSTDKPAKNVSEISEISYVFLGSEISSRELTCSEIVTYQKTAITSIKQFPNVLFDVGKMTLLFMRIILFYTEG